MSTSVSIRRHTASDGAELAWTESGAGEPVLLVHGSLTNHLSWGPVIESLAERAKVCAVDRRGRGSSGDGPNWSMEREADDLAELAASLGCTRILAHSFGALAVLHALPSLPSGTRAVLYEPPGPDRLHPVPGALEKVVATYEAGDLEGALRQFIVEELMLSEGVYAAIVANPLFETMREAAPTLSRELRAVAGSTLGPDLAGGRDDVAVLFLVADSGGSPMFRAHAEELAAWLPGARIETVGGIPHFAMGTDPTFVERAAAFLAL
jgi:pimeloyl-ACP methyl ester carboxylesterase